MEQHGKSRANYGEQLVRRLATDLTARFGRGFAQRNLERFRQFYLAYPQTAVIASSALTQSRTTRTAKRNPIASTALTQSSDSPLAHLKQIAVCFPLPWSHYLSLLGVKSETGRRFYEAEALRGGWTVRQLQRQVDPRALAGADALWRGARGRDDRNQRRRLTLLERVGNRRENLLVHECQIRSQVASGQLFILPARHLPSLFR